MLSFLKLQQLFSLQQICRPHTALLDKLVQKVARIVKIGVFSVKNRQMSASGVSANYFRSKFADSRFTANVSIDYSPDNRAGAQIKNLHEPNKSHLHFTQRSFWRQKLEATVPYSPCKNDEPVILLLQRKKKQHFWGPQIWRPPEHTKSAYIGVRTYLEQNL